MIIEKVKTGIPFSIFLTLFIGIVLVSCDDDDDMNNPDDEDFATESFELDDFHELEVRGSTVVYIDSTFEGDVQVTGDADYVANFNNTVENDRLVIMGSDDDLEIIISNQVLNEIHLKGSSKLYGDTIYSSNLSIELEGSTEIQIPVNLDNSLQIDGSGNSMALITGLSPNVTVETNGNPEIDTHTIESESAITILSGSGTIDVYAGDYFSALLSGSGTIRYWGDPELTDIVVTGSGEVLHME